MIIWPPMHTVARLAARYPYVPEDEIVGVLLHAREAVLRVSGTDDAATAVDLAELRLQVRAGADRRASNGVIASGA